jgi:hypothetical protein
VVVHADHFHSARREYIEVDLVNDSTDPRLEFSERWQTLKWQNVPTVNPMVGAVLGDFIHNVHSALDHAVWALVKANNVKPGTHTSFPISETERQWQNDVIHRDPKLGKPPTFGLSSDALQLVEDFQPFTAGKGKGSRTALYTLLRLSNIDKHRMLHAGGIMPATELDLSFAPSGYLVVDSIKHPPPRTLICDGAQMARVKLRIIRTPPDDIEVRMNQTQGVSFAFFIENETRPIAGDADLPRIFQIGEHFIKRASQLPESSL